MKKRTRQMKKNTRNWADAPPEIIGLIAERLHSIEDCVSFRGVCTSWRSACSNVSSKIPPWIVFFSKRSSREGHISWSFLTNKYYRLHLPDDTDLIISSSHCEWLLLSRGRRPEALNPVTGVCHPLPQVSTLQGHNIYGGYYFDKLVLVSPAKDLILVFAFFTMQLAFIRPGYSKTWTLVNAPLAYYRDILYLNSQFYAVDAYGAVTQFDITNNSPIGTEFAPPPAGIQDQVRDVKAFFLVEVVGKLYMLLKFELYRYAYFFRVFKLDLGTRKWEEVFTLGDYAVFVSSTSSFSVPVSSYPELRSSIYFMAFRFGERHCGDTMGIFNLETRVSVPLDPDYDVVKFGCSAVWFVPNLC